MADKKKEVETSKKFEGVVKNIFRTSKKEYKVGDTYVASSQESLDYLKSINKVK